MSIVLMGTSSILATGADKGVETGVEVVKEAASVVAIGTCFRYTSQLRMGAYADMVRMDPRSPMHSKLLLCKPMPREWHGLSV